MQPITFKKVYDSEGSFKHIEMIQGTNIITISLANEGTHRSGYRWSEIKEAIDALQNDVHVKAV